MADDLSGGALPLAGPHRIAECFEARARRTHVGHDIDAIDQHRAFFTVTQRNVKHRAILRRIDALAGEHGRPALFDPAHAGKLGEETEGLGHDAVFGIVGANGAEGKRQTREAVGVRLEQIAQMLAAEAGGVGLKRLPGGQRGQGG